MSERSPATAGDDQEDQTERQEMAKVEFFGRGMDLKMMELSPEMVTELTETGVDSDRMMEIEEQMLDDCEMWSGVIPDPGMFSIEVDGEALDRDVIDAILVKEGRPEAPERGKAYLVRIDWARGCWSSVESDGPFDPARLRFEVAEVTLFEEDTYQFMELTYDGESEFGETSGTAAEMFVITADGERQDIVEAEEE